MAEEFFEEIREIIKKYTGIEEMYIGIDHKMYPRPFYQGVEVGNHSGKITISVDYHVDLCKDNA